jgi:hypothetical protein
MKKKHSKILQAIFQKPVLANITWRDVENLFSALGAKIEPGIGSRVTVVLNEQVAVFHRPHPQKEANKGAVVAVKEFLILCGVEPC